MPNKLEDFLATLTRDELRHLYELTEQEITRQAVISGAHDSWRYSVERARGHAGLIIPADNMPETGYHPGQLVRADNGTVYRQSSECWITSPPPGDTWVEHNPDPEPDPDPDPDPDPEPEPDPDPDPDPEPEPEPEPADN